MKIWTANKVTLPEAKSAKIDWTYRRIKCLNWVIPSRCHHQNDLLNPFFFRKGKQNFFLQKKAFKKPKRQRSNGSHGNCFMLGELSFLSSPSMSFLLWKLEKSSWNRDTKLIAILRRQYHKILTALEENIFTVLGSVASRLRLIRNIFSPN